jgi:hypothetical protein
MHVQNLITVELLLFIKSPFTTNVLHLSQCTPEHIWLSAVGPCQRSRGGCEWVDRHKERVGVGFLHCKWEPNILGFLSAPTDKNLRDWGQHVVLYLENSLRSYIHMNLRCLYPPLSHPGSTLLAVITRTDCYPARLSVNLRYRFLAFFLSYSESWPVKMEPIRCPETSVNNYHTRPRNIPEERRSHQHRGGSLKSRLLFT